MPVPYSWPKSSGFNFLPAGTIKEYDAEKWALYWNPYIGMSFIVIDFPEHWKINHFVGKMRVSYATDRMRSMPCCQE
jgi:hypothetical protein